MSYINAVTDEINYVECNKLLNRNDSVCDFKKIQTLAYKYIEERYTWNGNSDDEENYEGEQNRFKKMLSNEWDRTIKWSIELGDHYFAITINTDKFCKEDGSDPKVIEHFHNFIRDFLVDKFPTITWSFIVCEKNERGRLHFHSIIAIRNFIDYNHTLKNNINDVFVERLYYYFQYYHNFKPSLDIKIQSLKYFKDVKNWTIYLHKDWVKWNYKASLCIIDLYYENDLGGIRGSLVDIYCYYLLPNNLVNYSGFNEEQFDKYKDKVSLLWSINGVRLTHNSINQATLVDLLLYYLILNEYYIHNNNIYEKIKDTKISYKLLGSLKKVLYDDFQQNVVNFYILNFEMYFKGFDFSYLLKNYFIKSKSVIESIIDISTQRIEPNFGLIEFSDGIYSIKYDRFFSNKGSIEFSNKISTIKFYDKSYNSVRRTKPGNWIKGLINALSIKSAGLNSDSFIKICLYLINTIHGDIFDKKSTLFIHGKSNTGKTSLIVDVLDNYFGNDNIGSIISSRNFKWQDIVGKLVAILDEGRYNSSMSSDLLKITGQERVIIEKKYSKEHISIDPIPIFILSNILFEDKDISIDEALKNRMFIVEFVNEICKLDLDDSKMFKKKIKDEESNIFIFCNKLLFKLKKNKNIQGMGTRTHSKNIVKLIENDKVDLR